MSWRDPDPARMAEFAATARRLQYERHTAAEIVQRLLRQTPRWQWSGLAEREELHTSGALEELGTRIEAQLDREPRVALVLTELATAIADALPPDAYPPVVLAQLRSHAWKDRGQALAYLARYDEALAALDRAEEVLTPHGTLAHDVAIVQYVRAVTLQNVNRFDESLVLLAECRRTFGDHADARRHLISGIAQGMLLQRLVRFREACDVYTPLIAIAEQLGDTKSQACLHNLLAHACVAIDELTSAEKHFARAVQLFTRLEQPLQAIRAEDGRGRVMLRRGEYAQAIRHLDWIRGQFLHHDLIEEAGICGLGIVEGLLTTGAASEAETLARTIVAQFVDAGLNTRAITALGYLAEAIAARSASGATVDTVREYIYSLQTNPEREFTAYQ